MNTPKFFKLALVFLLAMFSLASCEKDDKNPTPQGKHYVQTIKEGKSSIETDLFFKDDRVLVVTLKDDQEYKELGKLNSEMSELVKEQIGNEFPIDLIYIYSPKTQKIRLSSTENSVEKITTKIKELVPFVIESEMKDKSNIEKALFTTAINIQIDKYVKGKLDEFLNSIKAMTYKPEKDEIILAFKGSEENSVEQILTFKKK